MAENWLLLLALRRLLLGIGRQLHNTKMLSTNKGTFLTASSAVKTTMIEDENKLDVAVQRACDCKS